MNSARLAVILLCCAIVPRVRADDNQNWPQWRGPNRDAKTSGFAPPSTWPKELTQKWKVAVGEGPSSPALVNDKLYIIGRQEGDEVVRCLDAKTGNEIWQDKYPAQPPTGPAAAFSGPRSSPTVADGKVITLGVHGTLTCYDAQKGQVLWRKEGFGNSVPRFAAASSPLVHEGLCIAQVGGDRGGGIVAYDLATGEEKWKWTDDGPAYASPMLLNVDGQQAIVAVTDRKLVAISATDGKGLWQIPYTQGRYNAATPIVAGQTVIYAGPNSGITAVSFQKKDDALAADPKWKHPDNSLMYNTPVLRDGWLFGISSLNALFCVNADTGKSAWSAAIGEQPSAPPAGERAAADAKSTTPSSSGDAAKGSDSKDAPGSTEGTKSADAKAPGSGAPDARPPGGGRMGGGRMGGGRGMRGGGGGGYGSVVDAGSVLAALNPSGQLIFFEPSTEEFKQLAKYKVAESDAYAYPILAGNRIFIRDKDSVMLWEIE